jgi:hypothetical protein
MSAGTYPPGAYIAVGRSEGDPGTVHYVTAWDETDGPLSPESLWPDAETAERHAFTLSESLGLDVYRCDESGPRERLTP